MATIVETPAGLSIWRSQIARFMGPTWGHLGPTGPRWAPCWPHEPCYLGYGFTSKSHYEAKSNLNLYNRNAYTWKDSLYIGKGSMPQKTVKWPLKSLAGRDLSYIFFYVLHKQIKRMHNFRSWANKKIWTLVRSCDNWVNMKTPEKNGHHFADHIFLNGICCD